MAQGMLLGVAKAAKYARGRSGCVKNMRVCMSGVSCRVRMGRKKAVMICSKENWE